MQVFFKTVDTKWNGKWQVCNSNEKGFINLIQKRTVEPISCILYWWVPIHKLSNLITEMPRAACPFKCKAYL